VRKGSRQPGRRKSSEILVMVETYLISGDGRGFGSERGRTGCCDSNGKGVVLG
jgi:hypothetical protein